MERRTKEQGMALLAVVAVLIALVLIATPFALQMQSAADRSRNLLYTEQADQEANNLFALANLYLLNGVEELERQNAAKQAESIFATPDYDIPDEYRIPLSVISEFNENSAVGRIWDVRVEDEQGKLNVNSAPYTALANLLGVTSLAESLEEGDTNVKLSDGSVFPAEGGVIRVGSELIRYERNEGGRLYGVDRAYKSDEPWNSSERTWKEGEIVVNAAAFEIGTFQIRGGKGQSQPFKNIWDVKRISELGTAALNADTFEQAAENLTCWSGREVAGGWSNSQLVQSALPSASSGGEGDYVIVENPRYFGTGTLVRISAGGNVDYGVVIENNGRTITLGSKVEHEYQIGEARIESMARHPVNINTASDEVLVACLMNVRLRLRGGSDFVTREEALALIPRIRERPIKSLYQYKELLREAKSAQIISQPDYYALYLNALNPQDFLLSFSTVPFCFKSYDTYTITATAVVNSKVGQEIARKTLKRVVSVNPRQSAVWELRTQADFESQIIASRDAKWMMTYPYNTGGHYEPRNNPPSRFVSHLIRNIWPSTSTESGLGDVRLQPTRLDLDREDQVFHFDDSHYADGYYIRDGALAYSSREAGVQLANDEGMRPGAIAFWYRPFWGGLSGTQYLLDSGEKTWTNRVTLYLDPAESELVLRVADATLEQRASETRFKVDAGGIVDETWYHIAASVTGSRPADLTLLVDGNVVGKASHLTRLTQPISGTENISELYVEDADSFPQRGALLIRGAEGTEILEYNGKSGQSFSITNRFARERENVTGGSDFSGRSFAEGDVVELLGYSSPLVTDIPKGGAELNKELSLFHAMKVVYAEDVLYIPAKAGGGGGGGGGDLPGGAAPNGITIQDGGAPGVDSGGADGGGAGGGEIRGIAADRTTVVLSLGSGIQAWNSNVDDTEALKAFGETGFALLVAPGPERNLVPGKVIGGHEIVSYEKTGGGLTITRYQKTEQIDAAEPHFVPQHSFGNEASKLQSALGTGVPCALIPISIEGSGGAGVDYLSAVHDDELKRQDINATRCFAQIGTEWFAYTYPDTSTSPGKVLFVWDRPADIQSVVSLFGGGRISSSTSVSGGGTPDLPADPGDTPGGPPDGDNPDPEPPSPPPPDEPDPGPGGQPGPGAGDDDTGPPDGGGTPPGPDDPNAPPAPPDDNDDGPGTDPAPPPGADDPLAPPAPPDDDDTGPGTSPAPPPGADDPLQPPPPPEDDDTGPGTDPSAPPGPDDPLAPGPNPPDGNEPDPDGSEDPPNSEPQPEDAAGSSAGGAGDDVPFTEEAIAQRLKHRPYGDYLLGDTRAVNYHESGTQIDPAFIMTFFHGRRPGFDDLVTLATSNGPVSQYRIQHSYFRSGVQYWAAFNEFPSSRFQHSTDSVSSILAGTVKTRAVTRLLKFPSGELPDAVGANVYFGSRFDGGGVSQAFIDELIFYDNINGTLYRLGDGSALVADNAADDNDPGFEQESKTASLDAGQTEIYIHMNPTSGNPDGLPVTGLDDNCGIIRVDDELIFYRELDTATGKLSGCERGVLKTEARTHAFDAPLTQMEGGNIALLDGGLSSSASEIKLNRVVGFPRTGGYVRIGEEILGYTRIQGNSLIMPKEIRKQNARPATPGFGDAPEGDVDQGVGLLRARFGSIAGQYADKEIVRFFPARYPDRYSTDSYHPETSGVIFRKRVDGAIWKRVAWDEKLANNTDVRVQVRFDGTPAWDSENIYNVNEQMVVSGTASDFAENPKGFLYVLENAHDLNRLHSSGGIQADMIEIKITYQYLAGSFDPYAEPPANSWKDSPWLKALRVEYVAPVTVHMSEEGR